MASSLSDHDQDLLEDLEDSVEDLEKTARRVKGRCSDGGLKKAALHAEMDVKEIRGELEEVVD